NSSVDLLLYSVRLTKTCKGRNALRTALATAAPASVVPRDFNRFVPYQVRPRVSYTNSAEAIGVSPPAAGPPALGRLTQSVADHTLIKRARSTPNAHTALLQSNPNPNPIRYKCYRGSISFALMF